MTDVTPIPEQMYNAIQAGDVRTFRRLLDANPELFRYPDGRSMWLSDAASAGQLEIVKLLVSMGVDVNERADNDRTPSPENVVKRAASEGHLNVVRWFLDQGAEINHTIGGRVRCFPLVMACREGHLEIIKLLIARGAAFNSVWAEMSPLDHAIDAGHNEAAEFLRNAGAKTAQELGT